MSIRKILGPAVAAALGALLLLVAPNAASAAPGDPTAYPPPTSSPAIAINGNIGSGATVTIIIQNFYANETVNVTGASTPYSLGTYVTNAQGSTSFTVTLPTLDPGPHSITASGNLGSSAVFTFTVPESAAAAGGASGGGTATGGGSSDQLAWTGVAVGSLVLLAVGLLVAGTLVLLSGKRRTSA